MSITTFLLTIVGIGIGTFLIRFIPLYWRLKGQSNRELSGKWRRAINAVGPAAIVSLLTVAVWDLAHSAQSNADVIALVLGIAAVCLGKRYMRDVAAATFSGVIVYALILYWL